MEDQELDDIAAYAEYVRQGREAANSQWTLGDLAIQVQTTYGDHTLEKYADDIGVEYNTLRNYRYVSGQYQNARRRANLPWTVHATFAAQEDRIELIKANAGQATAAGDRSG